MHQLALDIQLADYAVFESFHAGPNAGAVHRLGEAAAGRAPGLTWVWGLAGSGRSHLLQACVSAAAASGQASLYLPLGDSAELRPDVLEHLGRDYLVCIDDVDAVAGDAEWERALFMLYEESQTNAGTLVIAADAPPAEAGLGLRDLQSRMSAGATFRLMPLDEQSMLAALVLRAHWRGLELPAKTGRYLMTWTERSAASLFSLLDQLVDSSLRDQRRLTVPFVRQALSK